MKYRRGSLISGAIALSSFFAVGTGAAASATSPHVAPAAVHATTGPNADARLVVDLKRATVHTTTATVNGKSETILVNAKDFPLYYFKGDTEKKSRVSGELAQLWPALVSAKPTGAGTRGTLASLKEADGRQVTYKGHFLYTFVDDTPGHVTGQGVSDFFVATPGLKPIGGAKKASTPAPTTSSGGGYGY
jgi:predicted lipoprotein with Yx(FWY)xxD motif